MSSRRLQSQVLVIGAGPVGLFVALCLARLGIDVKVIDSAWRATGRSYATALHPATLDLLSGLGLLPVVLGQAHRIDRIALFDGVEARARIELNRLSCRQPFVAVLPQADLEALLEAELMRHGCAVNWLHRAGAMEFDDDRVRVEVEVLESVPGGYAVATSCTEISRTITVAAELVVGADGYDSSVRRRLGIAYESWGAPESYELFEFASEAAASDEVRIVLTEASTDVLWPLPGGRARWSFQRRGARVPERTRVKSRLALAVPGETSSRLSAEVLRELSRERAPWLDASIGDIVWAGEVAFERRLAERFGQGRVWLLGDAAHQTGPVGIQSMNAGLLEAHRFAELAAEILGGSRPIADLASYQSGSVAVWCQLLGINEFIAPTAETPPWIRAGADRLLSCLPGTGAEMAQMIRQLGLTIAPD